MLIFFLFYRNESVSPLENIQFTTRVGHEESSLSLFCSWSFEPDLLSTIGQFPGSSWLKKQTRLPRLLQEGVDAENTAVASSDIVDQTIVKKLFSLTKGLITKLTKKINYELGEEDTDEDHIHSFSLKMKKKVEAL